MEFESWPSIRPDLFTMSDSFLHENQALTTALVTSLSDSSATGSPVQTQSAVSTPGPATQSNRVANGRVKKRKSRVSKKMPTTYINADPANFRRMVQQITGVSGSVQEAGWSFEPVDVFRPEPVRGEFGYFPTVDASTGLLGPTAMVGGYGSGSGSGSGVCGSGYGLEGNGIRFPTLESWSAM